MIYESAQDWLDAPRKRAMLFGMSGLGKTHVSNLLRGNGDWFHYSIDYRIGTRYMGELIVDNAKRHAMQVPFLRDLLLSDSIYIGSNLSFHNLAPVSAYLGKPGDAARGGLDIDTYRKRQEQFRRAEIDALHDTAWFIERAEELYGYPHFVCDTGGSICEWVDPDDPDDPLMAELSATCLPIWIEGTEAHTEALVRRFDKAPKPMAYQPEFLAAAWQAYLAECGTPPDKVDPDAFVRWTYARALAHRQPRYAKMAEGWGISVPAARIEAVRSADDFIALVAERLDTRRP